MSTALASLISAWRQVGTGVPPFQLSADADVLASADTVTHSYEEYSRDDFIFDRDTRLYLGLVPLPYGGDLRSATTQARSDLTPGFTLVSALDVANHGLIVGKTPAFVVDLPVSLQLSTDLFVVLLNEHAEPLHYQCIMKL